MATVGAGTPGPDERPEVLAVRRRRFVEVLEREPDVELDLLAERFGVDLRTIYRWKASARRKRRRQREKKARPLRL